MQSAKKMLLWINGYHNNCATERKKIMDQRLYKKDEIIYVTIEDMTITGEGVGKDNGFTIFVDGALPGEKVKVKISKVKKSYAIGLLEEIMEQSPNRVDPLCTYSKTCGGCQIQNIEYKEQLNSKRKIVIDALERIGNLKRIEEKVAPTLGMDNPYEYRNKAQYKISTDGQLGFYKKKSHIVIPVDQCMIQSEQSTNIMKYINRFIQKYKVSVYNEETHKGILRGIVERVSHDNSEVMLIFVLNAKNFKYKTELRSYMKEHVPNVVSIYFNMNMNKTNVVLSRENKLVYGKEKILDTIGELKYEISPLSFFQVNPLQTKVLYDKVVEFSAITGEETVLDLYCGIGTISLYLAEYAKKVYGVEIVPEAIKDAQANMKLNNIENTEFILGKSEEIMPQLLKEGIQANVVVVDPPRKGCEEKLLDAIIAMSPEKIIYVSCNPATLARDLKVLTGGGYEVEKVQPIDMFPHTPHVEVVVKLERKHC